ncbi:MAG TPA: RES domain-containing protein [Phenylobacterium sp.]
MRFEGTAYRAHDPRWSFTPLSGDGAALRGARFNPKGAPALYLSLEVLTAIKEANQGFARKIDPCFLCTYEVACEDIADLRNEAACAVEGVDFGDLDCPWFALLAAGQEPPTWPIARRLIAAGRAGVLVPSYAPGATAADHNLVLWRWGEHAPHRVRVYDPSGRLPKDQLSWR